MSPPVSAAPSRIAGPRLGMAVAATLCALGWTGGFSAALAAYPERDINFIVPSSPGGGFDSYVRVIGPVMERYLPQHVHIVPNNVPAAGGIKAVIQVYRANPDGYTIGLFNIPGAFILQRRGGADYDLTRMSWIGRIGHDDYGLAVAADSPFKSVADLQRLDRPIKFTCDSPVSTACVATDIASSLLGLREEVITGYRGSSDYVIAAARGDGDAAITTLPILRRMQAAGALRILAAFEKHSSVRGAEDATTLNRPALADITLERLVGGPPDLPPAIRDTLADALARAMADPEVKSWAAKTKIDLSPETPAEAMDTLQKQQSFFDRWGKLLDRPQ